MNTDIIDLVPSYPDYTTESDLRNPTENELCEEDFEKAYFRMLSSRNIETRRLIDHLDETGIIWEGEERPKDWWKHAIYKT